MSILSDLSTALASLDIPIETGVFSGIPPDEYLVITPLADTYGVFADNQPLTETQEVRLSLFITGNYSVRKKQIVSALLKVGITITDRRYIGHDDETGYHQYAIDAAKEYETEEE